MKRKDSKANIYLDGLWKKIYKRRDLEDGGGWLMVCRLQVEQIDTREFSKEIKGKL